MNTQRVMMFVCAAMFLSVCIIPSPASADSSRYDQWTDGPPTDPNWFPLAVWAQSTANRTLTAWKDAGINVYVGLSGGATTIKLNELRNKNMQVICHQNDVALANKAMTTLDGRTLIIAWIQQDEPDNAQALPEGGYGPPIEPSVVQSIYNAYKAADDTKPILLNLSQGIAWDNQTWPGQGGGINPAEDYPAYILGSDIISFDIYPMNCGRPENCFDAWRVALGVDRLFGYAPENHIVWTCIETGDISANGYQANGEQIRMEVWSAIIHGARGINYFIHGYSPSNDFDPDALLDPYNAENLAAVTALNAEVTSLAAVINSDVVPNSQVVDSMTITNPTTPIDYMVKVHEGATYIFTANMGKNNTDVTVHLAGEYPAGATVQVLGEDRQLSITDNAFSDYYIGFSAHNYKINALPSGVAIVDQHVFYNNSAFDGNDAAAGADDDYAIAIDKDVLLPGETATFANYSSYDKGINGIMIDAINMPGPITAADFEFHVGNDANPASWASGPAPVSVTTRPGEGVYGSDRITLIFPDGAITRQWLKVTVKQTAATDLVEDKVFYFGNAVGDTGDQVDNTIVDATDEIDCRSNNRHFLKPATIDFPYDHNRDGRVNATDEIIVRDNTTTFANSLQLITAP